MKKWGLFIFAILCLSMFACGGGGDGSSGGVGSAPVISNLSFFPTSAEVNEGGGAIIIEGSFDFIDGDGDASFIRIIGRNCGQGEEIQQDISVTGISGITFDTIFFAVGVSTACPAGAYETQIMLIDEAGNRSNILIAQFTLTGDSASAGWNPVIFAKGGFYCNNETPDIDFLVFNDAVDAFYRPEVDCNPNTAPIEPEFFGDHFLYIAMFNVDFPGASGSAEPVTITHITLAYLRPAGASPGAPELSPTVTNTNIVLPPVSEAEAQNPSNATQWAVTLVPISTKDEFRSQYEAGIRSADFPSLYEVLVTIRGSKANGTPVEVTTTAFISIGDYDYCECVE